MATRNILKDGERGLTKKSRDVTEYNKRLHQLIDDMRETLIEANGLGLAAPQVGVLRRVVLIVDSSDDGIADDPGAVNEETAFEELSDEELYEHINSKIIELINPEIITADGEQTGKEGCLSVPGVYGVVTRPNVVRVKAQDRHGKTFELETSELTARAVCHEVDHLNGVIFTSVAERILTEDELAGYDDENKSQGND
ncbi:MAG: peptide deformylase [Oscillospiraceae bacterium]|nr:peptide deformylase [Oscillospiraceae bacterium]